MKLSGVPEPKIQYAPKQYVCRHTVQKPVLDGRIEKPFWANAAWTEDFVDIEGDLRPRPSKRTRVKMLWDEQFFYIGAELEEDEIWATLTERDSVIFHDNDFEVFIDPDGDSHHYYELEVNALNTVWDLLLIKPYRDGGPPVNGWDIQGLKTAVHIDGELNKPGAENRKWSVECALPWSSLRECAPEGRVPVPGEFWRVNFSRVQWKVEIRDGKYSKVLDPDTGRPLPEDNWVWSPMGLINMHYPELWGYVLFAEAEDPDSFTLPPDEIIKWKLRTLYYRQRNYYKEHGVFTKNIHEIADNETWESDTLPQIEVTRSLFQISLPSADGNSLISIREDGKLWKE
ncbi:carbohydrate-binding family 9-like protein [Paenibacillus tuaregi]|uniref:carbohydrate-binding family 9-like protein n=1 Tax=Paenibacillus tuaregi TaxID=1816681 RepID=UPI0008381591|nr:carbohydrate-binding family 9-like protein [Paenibacillus tuaregi]